MSEGPRNEATLKSIPSESDAVVRRLVEWYFRTVYGKWEGPGVLPFYCDAARVGQFAVDVNELAKGERASIFRLLVTLAMFQARPDVRVMAQLRGMTRVRSNSLVSPNTLRRRISANECPCLVNAILFDAECSVTRVGSIVDCTHRPAQYCHVKEASSLLRRTGDMGKLPTSAYIHLWPALVSGMLAAGPIAAATGPVERAHAMVRQVSRIYRIGQKLATMFVSALSTPALAPGATPWFPYLDGSALVVVDTNVARAVDALRGPGAAQSYESRAAWVFERAALIDLRVYSPDLPPRSPRLVQQALYTFCSRSNRKARGDLCDSTGCPASSLCPFCSAIPSAKRDHRRA